MEQQRETASQNGAHADGAQPATAEQNGERKPARTQRFLLVRHGQSTFNVENRLPGQLPNIPLTDEGRRQAHQAAIALAGLRLSAVVSSPLERARETAEIIARGWELPVREEPRLMDTDIGAWAGRTISEVAKDDPGWAKFVEKPTAPPDGIEGFEQVRERAVAVIEALRTDPTVGDDVVVVAHADVIKLIIANYTSAPLDGARFIVIGNASISALAFTDGYQPALVAVNWTIAPGWLVSPKPPTPAASEKAKDSGDGGDGKVDATATDTGAPSGVIM
ncbi:MAG: histidine phosphatase family protein [Chloroflexota bacterium]|nr:histidine phosphatase family protein [Chloroflexota bacterium]